jgi:hypothetical protein
MALEHYQPGWTLSGVERLLKMLAKPRARAGWRTMMDFPLSVSTL